MPAAFLLFLALAFLSGCSAAHERAGSFQQPVLPAVKTVFLGDSITQYWGPGQQGDSNAFVVNPTWVDAGVYGETSGQILDRFQQDVVAQSPAIVHIMAGTNDVYPGWVLCGGTQDVDTCDNIKAMVSAAKAANIQVILCTIPPWGPGDASSGFDPSPARYDRINQLNQWIEQFAMDNQLTFIDYHQLLVSGNGNTYGPGLTVDGIHPSPQAYLLMTVLAEGAIRDAERK